jgi:hypothetical protein
LGGVKELSAALAEIRAAHQVALTATGATCSCGWKAKRKKKSGDLTIDYFDYSVQAKYHRESFNQVAINTYKDDLAKERVKRAMNPVKRQTVAQKKLQWKVEKLPFGHP